MKGIILAGGHGTRLSPITKGVCKQLLPVYDKPLIYYPLTTLIEAGIKEILIITLESEIERFQKFFGDGSSIGISLQYLKQDAPNGIAEAFLIAEDFIGNDPVTLILGDNIFFGFGLKEILKRSVSKNQGATVFGYHVKDPERYGIIEFDQDGNANAIIEKPTKPQSHWAVTGLYIYDSDVVEVTKSLKPSKRGELEITDVNNSYLQKQTLTVEKLETGFAWLDTGTYDALIDAAMFIKTIEDRQGIKVGCVEEAAYRAGFITESQLLALAEEYKTSYGQYLKSVLSNG